ASGRIHLSEHWMELLGYDARATTTTVPDLVGLAHPDDRQMLVELVREIELGHRLAYEAEHRVFTKDGAWKWILSRGKVIERTRDGRVARVIGTHVDISATKRRVGE